MCLGPNILISDEAHPIVFGHKRMPTCLSETLYAFFIWWKALQETEHLGRENSQWPQYIQTYELDPDI